jgi:molecular chaperone GrpE
MGETKMSDREDVERALKRVEELKSDDVSVDEIQVLSPSDGPPSGDPSDEGETMPAAVVSDDVDPALADALAEAADATVSEEGAVVEEDDEEEMVLEAADDDEGEEEELVIEDEPKKKNPNDALMQAMIAAKNEALEALDQTQREAKSMHDRLARVSANFENFKKRANREKDDAVRFANEKLLKEMLPVIDNMERAIEVARKAADGVDGDGDVVKSVVEGVELVHKSFLDTFAKFGVVSFTALGEQFDPAKHEAVAQREDASVPNNSVLEEYQRGYLLHERLVRPAMVIVASGGPPPGEKAAPPEADDAAEAPANGEAKGEHDDGSSEGNE